MNTLLLNLPNQDAVMRRYMCSYRAPVFLFPPQELISLGGIILNQKNQPVTLVDAIAEKIDLPRTLQKIEAVAPNILVTMIGFECFDNDIMALEEIKKTFPKIKIICLGHYPTIFPKEILQNTSIDIILLGEPELNFSKLYDALSNGKFLNDLHGIAYKMNGEIFINNSQIRIQNLDELPFPAYSLLNMDLYNEPFLKKPFTTLQTSRGCSFSCIFCVRTYGDAVGFQSAEKIFQDITKLVEENNITHFRFMDDTFTLKRQRILKLCKLITNHNLKIKWTALSRTDCLDPEMLSAMKNAGCQRIYIGIESGSQRILDYYSKGFKINKMKDVIKTIRHVGIEAGGMFIIGAPHENIQDLEESIKFAIKTDLDYIAISRLTAYPGTPLYEELKENIDFSLFPYKNIMKNGLKNGDLSRWEKRFYRRFYLRPAYIFKKAKLLFSRPQESSEVINLLMNYYFGKTSNLFSGSR